ncbi:MAG: exo-alpha-sialidase [Cyclobacteriaceae bacterium]|nr:exo-alpha-sialidase [Cyclobacteriaceae bacterium]
MKTYNLLTFLLVTYLLMDCSDKQKSPVVLEEFIYELADAKTPQCHASTIAASGEYLLSAWFGGTEEKNKDVGIWLSRYDGAKWSVPVEVVNGIQNDTLRYPCWNPVLFQPKDGPLVLFYKVGPSPKEWWGRMIVSEDHGLTWSGDVKLPEGVYGPIKNKPVQLENGEILCPTSTEHDGWKVQIERTNSSITEWSNTGDLNDGITIGAIQPAIFVHSNDKLQILCRTQQGFISRAWSEDKGKTWSAMELTSLPNPNSGIDGVTLQDGRHLLVYNPTGGDWGARVPLTVAVSGDGNDWKEVVELESLSSPEAAEKDEYSYPGIIQTKDGKVHIVYTWNRKTVKHVVLDPDNI